jgi:tRNA modification GTPase
MLLTKIYEILNNLITFNEEENIDIYSFELQRAIRYISEITGEVYTEDILKNIFDKFCIGK